MIRTSSCQSFEEKNEDFSELEPDAHFIVLDHLIRTTLSFRLTRLFLGQYTHNRRRIRDRVPSEREDYVCNRVRDMF